MTDRTESVLPGLHASTISHRRVRGGPVAEPLPAFTILAHPDPGRIGQVALLPGLRDQGGAALSRLEPLFVSPGAGWPRPLADAHLSRRPLRLDLRDEMLTVERTGVRTLLTVDGVEVESDVHHTRADLAGGVVLVLADRVTLLLHLLVPLASATGPDFGIVGASQVVVELRERIREIAPFDVPVLLRGDTGTGKELAARALHDASPRRDGPWVSVNMGALPPSLAAAELFGAARGAYTGADRRRRGLFARADGGTLFLDEIGEASAEVQVLLLRVLETSAVQAIGEGTTRKVDVRVVAATDAALEDAIRDGRFRAPLLHRLAGYTLALPSLRMRREDIGRLVLHFLRTELRALGASERLEPAGARDDAWLDAALVGRLARFDWPGNVRQLRNACRQLAIAGHARPRVATTPELEQLLDRTGDASSPVPGPATPDPVTPDPVTPDPVTTRESLADPVSVQPLAPRDIDDERLVATLRAHRFRVGAAARELGISRTSLYKLIDASERVRKAGALSDEEIRACRRVHDGDLDAMAEALEVSRKGLRRRMTDLGIT